MSDEPQQGSPASGLEIHGARAMKGQCGDPPALRVSRGKEQSYVQGRPCYQRDKRALMDCRTRYKEDCCSLDRGRAGHAPSAGPLRILKRPLDAGEPCGLQFSPAESARLSFLLTSRESRFL